MDKIEKQNLGIFFFLNDSQAKTTSNTLLLYVVNITCCNKREIGYVCVLGGVDNPRMAGCLFFLALPLGVVVIDSALEPKGFCATNKTKYTCHEFS